MYEGWQVAAEGGGAGAGATGGAGAGAGAGWRRRGRPAARPDARAERTTSALRAPVCAELPERAVVDVDLAEAATDQLRAEVAAARKAHVGEESVVAVASGLGHVARQGHALALHEPPRSGCRLVGVTSAALGRVDADQPHALALAACETHVDRIAVNDGGHGALQREPARGTARRSGDRRDGERGRRQECEDKQTFHAGIPFRGQASYLRSLSVGMGDWRKT